MALLSGQILRAADLTALLPDPTDYTPTNLNISIGNGVMTARYMLIGKMCHVIWLLDAGTTTSFTGDVGIGLPFPSGGQVILNGLCRNSTIAGYAVTALAGTGVSSAPVYLGDGSTTNAGKVGATHPFTVTDTDSLRLSGTYQIA